MKKIIVLFGCDDLQGLNQAYALQDRTKAMDVTVCRVRPEDCRRTMLSLVQDAAAKSGSPETKAPLQAGRQSKGLPSSSSGVRPARMLLFAAFSDRELYSVLDLCPACGITRDDLKAAMTPANSRWDAFRLCENILEEHRKLGQK